MPDRWRTGNRNPFTVYRVADGAHDVDHAREHFVTSFRREEDARLAVEAVNAQADRVGLDYPAGRWRDVYVRVHGDKEVATTEQVTDTIRIDWSAPNGAGEVDIVGVEVVAATGVEVDGEPTTPPACDCPDTNGAEPAGSAVGQRGAPARGVDAVDVAALVTTQGAVAEHIRTLVDDLGLSSIITTDPRGIRPWWNSARHVLLDEQGARAAEKLGKRDGVLVVVDGEPPGSVWERAVTVGAEHVVALPEGSDWLRGRLRGAGADGGRGDDEPEVDLWHEGYDFACEQLVARLASALGVSLDPDDPDPVGTLEAAAGKAREVEVVTSKQAVALPPGSWVLRCHQNGTPWLNASPRPADAIGSAGDPRWLVLYRAPAPAPAALAVGEVVESAADLATRVVDGVAVRDAKRGVLDYWDGHWHLTGMSGGPVVPAMPVRVLDVPEPSVRVGTGGGES